MREPLLEDYVVPVCAAEQRDGRAYLKRLFGTAFFVNNEGGFLTAAHVLRSAGGSESACGLVTKTANNPVSNRFTPLRDYEFAPPPFDIAVGRTKGPSRSWFGFDINANIAAWQDVATLGYPATTLNQDAGKFNVHLRSLKGYVQRPIADDELSVSRPHPESYELSFPIPQGMSGSPLFVVRSESRQVLVGVCVGSYAAEVVDYDQVFVEEDGRVLAERRVKAEQYGLAHALNGLHTWKPKILGGRTLTEAITPTR